MELKHIPLDQLHVSPINMRYGKRAPDISDILPSVRTRGILQPLLVRPNAKGFEIVAGRRRYFCVKAVAAEKGESADIPCAVMELGDDAAALEASLIENVARLDADEMTQFETFAKLIREGRDIESIAATFGISELTVKQRLALGNLLPKIREAFRAYEIDSETARYLTMASKAQQKTWLELYEEKGGSAPFGYRLKQWLFGGQSISTKTALFPLDQYTGPTVTDLFEEDAYFTDAEQFWQLQTKAIEAKRVELLAAKWSDVVVMDTGHRFDQWEYEKTKKKNGGKVFITLSNRGEVEIHEGWLSRKEARKKGGGKAVSKDSSPEPAQRSGMTQTIQNYLELHRHAAVRLALLASPDTALRLLVAHAVASSGNWLVKPDPQRSRSPEIAASIEKSPAQAAFAAEREQVTSLLGLSTDGDDEQECTSGKDERTARVFAKLLTLSDEKVRRIAAFVMAETLAVGSQAVETAGVMLKVDARSHWQPNETFLSLVRDRATLTAMVAETAGKDVAKANAEEKTATLRQIVLDALTGKNGRAKAENWLPGWMAFPFRAYGKDSGGISAVAGSVTAILRKK